MSPLPELNLNLGMSKDNNFSLTKNGKEEVMVRTDSALRKYTISLVISDQEAGTITLQIDGKEINVPTYKLTVTDDKTGETQSFQVTRDVLRFAKTKTKKSLLSFFGFKKFDRTSHFYENIPFEPKLDDIETFDISAYRKLSHDTLVYQLERNGEKKEILLSDEQKGSIIKKEGRGFVGARMDNNFFFARQCCPAINNMCQLRFIHRFADAIIHAGN